MRVTVIQQKALVGSITMTTYGVLVDGVPRAYFTDYETLKEFLEGLGIKEKSRRKKNAHQL